MSKNIYFIIGIILLVILGTAIYLTQKGQNTALAPTTTENQTQPVENQTQPIPNQTSSEPTAGSESQNNQKPQNAVITYTDAGFLPSPLGIKVGTTVAFKNNSSRDFWPASAVHPTHRAYPTTGGCLGSTFDACQGIPPGGSWSFKFDIPGTWGYHDHLSASHFGKVIVQ